MWKPVIMFWIPIASVMLRLLKVYCSEKLTSIIYICYSIFTDFSPQRCNSSNLVSYNSKEFGTCNMVWISCSGFNGGWASGSMEPFVSAVFNASSPTKHTRTSWYGRLFVIVLKVKVVVVIVFTQRTNLTLLLNRRTFATKTFKWNWCQTKIGGWRCWLNSKLMETNPSCCTWSTNYYYFPSSLVFRLITSLAY